VRGEKCFRGVRAGVRFDPVLRDYRLRTGGAGLLFRASGRGGRPGRPATFLQPHTLWKRIKTALEGCSLPPLSWYSCTRHSFASHFVMGAAASSDCESSWATRASPRPSAIATCRRPDTGRVSSPRSRWICRFRPGRSSPCPRGPATVKLGATWMQTKISTLRGAL
jgi:hypothetical protein